MIKNLNDLILVSLIMLFVAMITIPTLYKTLKNRKTFPIKERSVLLTFLYGFCLALSIFLILSG